MISVKAHERRPPAKSPEYINTHMALMTSAEKRKAFAERHGVQTEGQPSKSIIERFMPWFGRRG